MEEETIEEAAGNRYAQGIYVVNGIDIYEASRECFIEGAKWQKERSRRQMIDLLVWRETMFTKDAPLEYILSEFEKQKP